MTNKTAKKLLNRQRRTLFLAIFAAAAFAWSAIYIFEVDVRLMYDMFLMSLLLLSVIVTLALVFSIVFSVLKNRNSE